MPRPANPARENENGRTRAWRQRKAQAASPEASAVDIALAAAVAAYAAEADRSSGGYRKVLIALLRATVDLLVAKGFDRKEAGRMLRSRLARGDLPRIVETARIADNVPDVSTRGKEAA
jgi:hypothetical protein